MSAIGPQRTSLFAPHMSAFGVKADMADCGSPLSRSLLGVKRTWPVALHMSAYDPKRTWRPRWNLLELSLVMTAGGATCSDAVEAGSR
jgi:hypothetical protein